PQRTASEALREALKLRLYLLSPFPRPTNLANIPLQKNVGNVLPCAVSEQTRYHSKKEDESMSQYVYAGAAPFSGASDISQPGGLFRLAVGEGEWQPLRQGLPDRAEVRAIAIHPHNPRIVYAGAQDGPYRTLDGGDHWERLNFPEKDLVIWSILFHSQNPQVMYVGTAPTAVFRSDDAGGGL